MKNTRLSCEAVPGCSHEVIVQKFVAGSSTLPVCGMHRARWIRHRDFGTIGPREVGADTPAARRNTERAAKRLSELHRRDGAVVELRSAKGRYEVRGRAARFGIPNTQMTSWRERGWVTTRRAPSGETILRITRKGASVLRERR